VIRALLDTNVVLDVLLARTPFDKEAVAIWDASDAGKFDGYVASFAIPTIYYICKKHRNAADAGRAIDLCLKAFEVAALYRECIIAAQQMAGNDFEDRLQIACAITDFMHCIVSRNVADFAGSPIPVYTPKQFLELLNK
jgi:predicted nucleic acid-binding protein